MKVSVWIGSAASWDELDACLTFTFTEDGDAIPCPFGNAFGIDWFDEDFREASVSDSASLSARELLARHSDGSAIADAMGGSESLTVPSNAVVLLYDFQYTGDVQTADLQNVTLRFIGCFELPG